MKQRLDSKILSQKRVAVYERSRRGFTLVELLIVISIIGILTTIITVSVSNSRARARDAQRSSDLQALNSAIVMYYQANGHYPSLPAGCGTQTTFSDGQTGWINSSASNNLTAFVSADCLTSDFIANIASNYIDKLPTDPVAGQNDRGYIYSHYVCSGDNPTGVPNDPTKNDPSSCGNRAGLECYKIAAYNPENPTGMTYQNIWDPKRDGGNNDSIVDGTGIWAWAIWSQGCAAL
ncbi:MAG: prepilin-type N-terminal cleavage/methylation domain-containing protein [Candidatus Berkelbacteria bacterium]|nr:prepilin-type N-terminal cleavage/methylation domain-containing protein [Candidatus Berkelbacteria bacterium]